MVANAEYIYTDLPEYKLFNGGQMYDAGTVGSKLMCSRCCCNSVTTSDSGVMTKWFGTEADQTTMSDELIKDLLIDLTPIELKKECNPLFKQREKLNLTLNLSIADDKFLNGIREKIRNEKPALPQDQMQNEVDRLIITVQCSVCNSDAPGRFNRMFKRSDIELLCLYCNSCGKSFNGCDPRGKPILINEKMYQKYLREVENENFDICTFINKSKRRQDGYAVIKKEAFIKRKCEQIKAESNAIEVRMGEKITKRCPKCKNASDDVEGCSAIACQHKVEKNGRMEACGYKWCFICSSAVNQESHGGHDGAHFITNLPEPYGGFYGIQCRNVNFSIIDPDGRPGPHAGTPGIKPNPAFKELTRVTWRKFQYLHDKYQKEGKNPLETIMKSNPRGDNDTWIQLGRINYNVTLDRAYETGGENDPVIATKRICDKFGVDYNGANVMNDPPIARSGEVDADDVESYHDTEQEANDEVARNLGLAPRKIDPVVKKDNVVREQDDRMDDATRIAIERAMVGDDDYVEGDNVDDATRRAIQRAIDGVEGDYDEDEAIRKPKHDDEEEASLREIQRIIDQDNELNEAVVLGLGLGEFIPEDPFHKDPERRVPPGREGRPDEGNKERMQREIADFMKRTEHFYETHDMEIASFGIWEGNWNGLLSHIFYIELRESTPFQPKRQIIYITRSNMNERRPKDQRTGGGTSHTMEWTNKNIERLLIELSQLLGKTPSIEEILFDPVIREMAFQLIVPHRRGGKSKKANKFVFKTSKYKSKRRKSRKKGRPRNGMRTIKKRR
jgi:hypothetical protein